MSDRPPRTPQEFRRFVSVHHPDRGGDPAVFAAGVSAWRARQEHGPPVVFYRRRSRSARLLALLRLSTWTSRRRPRTTRRRVR